MSTETTTPEIENQELVRKPSQEASQAAPLEQDLGQDAASLGVLMDIDMQVTVELGRARMQVREILDLAPGSVVELGKPPSEPVDLMVNGVLTARGEVVVVDDHFAVRITKLMRRGEALKGLV